LAVHELKASNILIILLLIVSLISAYPAVEAAQTTRIHQVNSPGSGIAGSQNPIPVTATVYYNDTTKGYYLVVGILDAGISPQRIVPGFVTSSTDPCVNQTEPAARCVIKVPVASGVENIDFQIGGIFGGERGPGRWNLNITSALFDTQNNLVPDSASSTLFEINLTPVSLNVIVPTAVAVSVDGVQQSPGPATVGVALGQHNITVPALVQIDPATRLRFSYWSDGVTGTIRTILVTNQASFEAVYVTQHLLTIVGTENATGAGWYDADTSATFSVNQYEPMIGPLGAIGARLTFQGWYENGQPLTNSPSGTVSMEKPHTLTAVWQVDYSISAVIILGLIAAVGLVYLIVRRTKTKPPRKRRPRTRRRRS
jgi:hypothetical protein